MEKLLFSTLRLIFGALLTIFGAVLIMKSKEKKSDNIIKKLSLLTLFEINFILKVYID